MSTRTSKKNYKYGYSYASPTLTIILFPKIGNKNLRLNWITPQRNFNVLKFHFSTSIFILLEAMGWRHQYHVLQILHPFFFVMLRRRRHCFHHRIIILSGLITGPKRLCSLCRRLLNVPGIRCRRHRQPVRGVGEIETGRPSPKRERCHVVRTRRHLRREKGPQPNPGLLIGLAHLAHPLAGVPPPDAAVHRVARLPELLPPGAFLGVRRRQEHLLVRQRRTRTSRHRRGRLWVGGKHDSWRKVSFLEVVWVNGTTCAKGAVISVTTSSSQRCWFLWLCFVLVLGGKVSFSMLYIYRELERLRLCFKESVLTGVQLSLG